MKRKKQGASLIVVVIVFMFLTTVSIAMLSMIATNYKARVMESKRIENLYASDSGLDVAYNIIAKTFDAATKYGYYEVQALKSSEGNPKSPNNVKYKNLQYDINDLNDDIDNLNKDINALKKKKPTDTISQSDIDKEIEKAKNLIEKKEKLIEESKSLERLLLNEEFKRTFKNFIIRPTNDGELGDDESAPDKLKESIDKYKFIDVSLDASKNIEFTEKKIEFGINDNIGIAPTLNLQEINFPVPIDQSATDQVKRIDKTTDGHHETVEITITPEQKYSNIKIASNFYTEKFNQNDNGSNRTNERILEETFDMIIPNFKDVYYQEAAADVKQYLATQDRAITVYGNMNVSGANNLTVNGEIFVEGSTPDVDVSTRSYKKYNGGIMIANSKAVNFNDNVMTRNSFNIRDNAEVTLGKNLYGRNVYVGGKYYSDDVTTGLNEVATGSTLNVYEGKKEDATKGQIVIDNDLALKAQESHIRVKDFYGINDKNIGQIVDGNVVDKVKSSSSIIVNTSDKSSINIENSAYIMGTAHINTNEQNGNTSNQYQTGESGAVKGNYIAYSVPLNEAEGFGYYDPLQLLDKVKNNKTGEVDSANVFDKSKHFTDYWNGEISKNNGHNPDTGGIIWPTKNGSINTDNIFSVGAIVYDINGVKQAVGSRYSIELEQGPSGVVYKKQEEFARKVYRFNQSATKEYDYDKTKVTSFSSMVNTGDIPKEYDLHKQNSKGEYAIFNGDKSKPIKIKQSTDGVEKIKNNTDDIEIYVSKKGTGTDSKYTLNAVIVTAGNLSIDYGITVNGCIIVTGDLNINNQNEVTVNYDQGVIERVQAQNSNVFEAVFGGYIIPSTSSNATASTSGNIEASYDLNYFLEKKLWKINK